MNATPPLILLVDDDEGVLLMREVLVEYYRVVIATHAIGALAIVRKHRLGAVDAVVTDVQLYPESGIWLARQIRADADPVVARVAIVLHSGAGAARYERAAKSLRATYVEKPVGPAELVAAVDRAILGAR